MSKIDAYPLQWPIGYPRTKYPKSSSFDVRNKSFADCRDELMRELRLMRATRVILSTSIPLRLDGLPYSGRREPDDSGIAVYFTLDGEQNVMACDAWSTTKQNVRGITKSIEALRGLDRWGCTEITKRAFTGFKALPAPGETTGSPWWEILGVHRHATTDEIKKAYRLKAKMAHPDSGGTEHSFDLINTAYKQARAAAA